MTDLVRGVRLLCLDAGNTVIFLDHDALAAILRDAAGFVVAPSVLVRTEGEAKQLAETGEQLDVAWAFRDRPGASSWGKTVGTIAHRAGLPRAEVPIFLEAAWRSHEKLNLWRNVPEGLGAALDTIRAKGVKVAIVSNSEGMLEGLFRELGILQHFDTVVDSGLVGVEKPDPRIFEIALERTGKSREEALHLGDVYATDILGARAAGIRCAMIDPFRHYEGRHLDVPRVPNVASVARAIAAG